MSGNMNRREALYGLTAGSAGFRGRARRPGAFDVGGARLDVYRLDVYIDSDDFPVVMRRKDEH